MILIDSIGHMVSTKSEEELHKFAKKIGLKREWFQQPRKPLMVHAHYDLTTPRKKRAALLMGAKMVGSEIVTKAWWAKEKK